MVIRSAVLLVHTVGCCYDPLTGDDGPSAVVAVAVVKADLPGPPAQGGLNSSDYPGQLCSCPTLYTEAFIREEFNLSMLQQMCFLKIGSEEGFVLNEKSFQKVYFHLLTETLQSDNLPCDAALPK